MVGMEPQPTLDTVRLLLRPLSPSDAGEVRRLAGDEAIASTTLAIPHPYPEGLAEQWIASLPGKYAEGSQVTFGIERREDGAVVGAIGLLFISREHENAEMGYWIGTPFWGRGYATEAARAVLGYGFGSLGLHRIYAHHFHRNAASGRVMQKLGMTREGRLRHHVKKWGGYEDLEYYGILREEFAG